MLVGLASYLLMVLQMKHSLKFPLDYLGRTSIDGLLVADAVIVAVDDDYVDLGCSPE